jgi:hypothetical protein
MQKIVLKDGRTIDVDFKVDKDDWFQSMQKAVMVDNAIGLKDVWVYEFLSVEHSTGKLQSPDIEFIDFYVSEKELTKEQIIYQMSKRDLSIYDVVIPHKAFVLGFLEED